MVGERIISPEAQRMISVVAPGYEVRRNAWGRSELQSRPRYAQGRDNLWQRAMMRFVRDFNFGDPVSKINPETRSAESFQVVMNDALHSVASVQDRPTKAGVPMAIIGWFPGIPLIYDVPALVGAVGRRMTGRDFGRVLPYAWMTFFDALRTAIPTPGSVRSLRLPVYEYQQTMQILFADDMNRSLSSAPQTPEDVRAQQKYLAVADYTLDYRKREIKSAREAVERLTDHVLTQKGQKWDKKQPLPKLSEQDVKTHLHDLDQVRYFVGASVLHALEVAQSTRDVRRQAQAAQQGPRRVR